MNDLIKREDVIKIIDEEIKVKSDYLQHNAQIDIMYKVQELPSETYHKGKWIECPTNKGYWICTECGRLQNKFHCCKSKFCPNCGADMRDTK